MHLQRLLSNYLELFEKLFLISSLINALTRFRLGIFVQTMHYQYLSHD
jgi:hypothetical protein